MTDVDVPAAAEGLRPARHVAIWMRLAIGVVVAVAGTVVLVKVVGDSATGPRTTTDLSPTSATTLAEVTSVPASVFDAVGVGSTTVPVTAPEPVRGPALTATVDGRSVPVVVFVGAEYCSFCAAERWPLIVALSRFGTFHRLYDVQSSSIDFAPNTPTFSFYDTRYESRYLEFHAYEVASDVLGTKGYEPLMTVPDQVAAIQHRYDPTGTLPFVDVGNALVARTVALSPVTFVGYSRDQVAGGLTDATDPVTAAIAASSNYLSAGICEVDGEVPSSVCDSPGVRAADERLGSGAGGR